MPINVACSCGKKLAAPDKFAGKRVKCPACGGVLAIPGGAPAAPKAAPQATAPAPPSGGACIACKAPIQSNAIICIQCGINQQTGEPVSTTMSSLVDDGDVDKKGFSLPVAMIVKILLVAGLGVGGYLGYGAFKKGKAMGALGNVQRVYLNSGRLGDAKEVLLKLQGNGSPEQNRLVDLKLGQIALEDKHWGRSAKSSVASPVLEMMVPDSKQWEGAKQRCIKVWMKNISEDPITVDQDMFYARGEAYWMCPKKPHKQSAEVGLPEPVEIPPGKTLHFGLYFSELPKGFGSGDNAGGEGRRFLICSDGEDIYVKSTIATTNPDLFNVDGDKWPPEIEDE